MDISSLERFENSTDNCHNFFHNTYLIRLYCMLFSSIMQEIFLHTYILNIFLLFLTILNRVSIYFKRKER